MEQRPIQTRIKHFILREYLKTWSSIIWHGLYPTYQRSRREHWSTKFQARLVYVDCFAFEGLYQEGEDIVEGSPLIGIQELDKLKTYAKQKGFVPETTVLLFEEDSTRYAQLVSNLQQANYGPRLVTEARFEGLPDQSIVVLPGDYQDYLEQVLRLTGQNYTFSLYLLDPYGVKGLPFSTVSRIAHQDRVDVIINFSMYTIYPKVESAAKGLKEHKEHIRHITDLYGREDWWQTARDLNGIEREAYLVGLYEQTLAAKDPDLAIKRIPLKLQDIDKLAYYLILTTHDGTGGLKMNEILDLAALRDYDARQEHRLEKQETQAQMKMFDLLRTTPCEEQPESREADIPTVARLIQTYCQGCTLPYREILRRMVQTSYYERDVREAMTWLKKRQLVQWTGQLRNQTDVTFTAGPST